jgi:RNA repair pathway DNA polymerase beta family
LAGEEESRRGSAGKAIRQALRADPNTLEMLFLPNATPLDPIGEWLLEARDAFVSVEIYGTFGRYALGQLRRLAQGLRLAEHRGVILEWLRAEPELTLDAVASRLADVSARAAPSEADEVMKRVLREEEARREHIVVYLSGAHAYGFPSPDSDLAPDSADEEDLVPPSSGSPSLSRIR